MANEDYPFILTFDPRSSDRYPEGYWYASTGDYDADGESIEQTLAKLIAVMHKALERSEQD